MQPVNNDQEINIREVIEELLRIQARIICLEQLYAKFVNVSEPSVEAQLVSDEVASELRNERRKLVEAIKHWLGAFS